MNFTTFINRFFGRDESEGSKNTAKERLRLVLVHDRLDVSEKVMNALRVDLINLIGKYFGIDDKAVEVSLSREADGMALVANIPIRRHLPEVFSSDEDAKEAEDEAKPLLGEVKAAITPKQRQALPKEQTKQPPFLDLSKKFAVTKPGGGKQNGSKQNGNKQSGSKKGEIKQGKSNKPK